MDPMLNEVMMLALKLEGNVAYTDFLLIPLQEALTKASPYGGQ